MMKLLDWLKGIKEPEEEQTPEAPQMTADQINGILKQMNDPRWLKTIQLADEADLANRRR